mmetsp:Transcript_62910/g.124288  ORF Transcript_62910/g.124288 Transcript_62910/m.124288 type:complete len:287 (-) Transcript_62910:930-1790(-)
MSRQQHERCGGTPACLLLLARLRLADATIVTEVDPLVVKMLADRHGALGRLALLLLLGSRIPVMRLLPAGQQLLLLPALLIDHLLRAAARLAISDCRIVGCCSMCSGRGLRCRRRCLLFGLDLRRSMPVESVCQMAHELHATGRLGGLRVVLDHASIPVLKNGTCGSVVVRCATLTKVTPLRCDEREKVLSTREAADVVLSHELFGRAAAQDSLYGHSRIVKLLNANAVPQDHICLLLCSVRTGEHDSRAVHQLHLRIECNRLRDSGDAGPCAHVDRAGALERVDE